MTGWRSLTLLCLGLSLKLAGGGTLAQFRTPFGDIEVELYDKEKPGTVQNFKNLVQAGAYQNTFFHRLVPSFVVQGGGFVVFDPTSGAAFGPPWANVGYAGSFGSISNEFNIGPKLSNTNGTIAMAKVGSNPDSASNQWFFNLADNSANLDNQNGGFTVFGHVVRDANNLLPLFNTFSYGHGLANLGNWYPTDYYAVNVFNQLPVNYAGTSAPTCTNLVYVDVSLLSVRVALTNGQRQISWKSVNGKTNLVEFTTSFPAAWKTLAATNGTGSPITVADSSATNAFRFYRVRVLYP